MLSTSAQSWPSHIFRAYDIRGLAHTELSTEIVHDVGVIIGSEAREKADKTVIVARDARLSGRELMEALIKGVRASGCNVIDVGIVPTPLLYFAIHHLNAHSGIMLTGSHNPPEYNGLKMVVAGQALSEQEIQHIFTRIKSRDFKIGHGHVSSRDIRADYIAAVLNRVKLSRRLKVVVDAGNGVAGGIAPNLYNALGCEVVPLYCEMDGMFPNHHPDPSKEKNLRDLIVAVKQHKADIGLAFDGDGDRLGVVTPQGKIIWPDRQLMLFAKDVLKKRPGATVLFDVKCSKHVSSIVAQYGGVPIMSKTGHSLIKKKMKEVGAILAGEMSGHIFFKDNWFGFDDGLFSGARLLAILAAEDRDADQVFCDIPESVSTPEINIAVTEQEKFGVIKRLTEGAIFPNGKIITIDGLRVEFPDGWALIRASNTTPLLVLRFEADNEASLHRIKTLFASYIKQQVPHLALPF